jgi:hypothetical protein
MKTLGQKLMDEARVGNVKLTSEYWGSQLSYEGPGDYRVLHFRQKFGGMAIYKTKRVAASELKACDSHESMAALLEPENDCAPGDPMHYTPRDVQPVELTLS